MLTNFKEHPDGSSEQPSANHRQTSLFDSDRRASAGNLQQCSMYRARVIRCLDVIATHCIRSWADVKSEGFCGQKPLTGQLFCIKSTSAPVETVFSRRGLYTPSQVLLKCYKMFSRKFRHSCLR